ncbi:hypothetical protein E0M29_28245 [Bacillus cereus]|uniref:hypothetical protein n=1 Tax=Bacillus cereus TaxID=1396 RepID=UPI00103F5031|nr:hypothetical protein [Bacillus cereus]TBX83988.1 hypothetical protein E0M29_28245 [Bacillus cereus]
MIATVLAFTGGVATCVAVYKIVSIIKEERKNKANLISDVKRLKDKVKFMEIDLDWMKIRADNWEDRSFEIHNLKSELELIKSKLEEGNAEDK